jgi:hypothetical protein
MAEDRYERVLFNLIEHHKRLIKYAERDIRRLNIPRTHPSWSDKNLGTIEMAREQIKKSQIQIDTIWVCVNHYRALLGVNNVNLEL